MSDETPMPEDEGGQRPVPTFDLSLHQIDRPTDLVERMRSILGRACSRHAMRDKVSYAVGVHLVPQGADMVMPCLAVTLAIPSLVIDQNMQGTVILQDMHMSEEAATAMVADMLGNLRSARIAQAGSLGQNPNGQHLG